MNWLVKTEPETYSIEDLCRDKKTQWDSVRNYQARNYLKEMKVGEKVLIYHSNADPSGVVGLAKVVRLAYPDPLQFDKKSDYFDPKATKEEPRWFAPDLGFVRQFPKLISINELRNLKPLKNMQLLKRGSRLSAQPVTDEEFEAILKLAS